MNKITRKFMFLAVGLFAITLLTGCEKSPTGPEGGDPDTTQTGKGLVQWIFDW